MKKIMFIPVLIFLLGSKNASAQTDDKTRQKDFTAAFNNYINKVMEKIPYMPAIAVVVIKNDQPLFVKAYGMADKETGTKADVNTLFYIASSTKSFTALAAALLDKEGVIALNDPVTKYTGGITFRNPLPERIKVRDLLTHTSGLQNTPLTFRLAYSGQVEQKDMFNVFAGATRVIDSNYGRYNYDNLGYNIYGLLLQHHTGKRWQDVLQEKIFDPLKMKHTTAYISKALSNRWNMAYPYMYSVENGTPVRSVLGKTDNNMQSAGGIFASISDIGTWLNMNMNNGKLNGKQVMPADIIQKCHTGYAATKREQPPFSGDGEYGLGWQIGRYQNEKVIYHHGGFPGYTSHISFMPDKKIAVAVMVNEAFAGGRVGHLLATYAYDWWLQKENVEENYAKILDGLAEGYAKGVASMKASAADRAKRTSQLTMAPDNYTGTYSNNFFGTIEVVNKDNTLAVKMGNINAVSTPFTEKETIRVEMIPGSGEVIRFKKNGDDKIESLNYAGVEYVKAK
jgi:CubicO group peptidase (beta-lactamase class C family)